MAGLSSGRPAFPGATTGSSVRLALLLVAILVALALVRIAMGWTPLAPDDARYLFVGLSILDGQGAVTPSGDPYLLRSPVYGVALALGSRLVGGDPIDGARVVAVGVSLLGLLGAVRIAWLAAGPGAAVGAALGLAATPLLWQLLPSLRIDLPQTAIVVAVLLLAWRPTTRRWAAAGAVLGIAVLVKETALPLLLLPLALLGLVPAPAVRRLAVVYVAAAVATAGWWWVVVWAVSGRVFPADALALVEARDVAGSLQVPWDALPILVAFVAAWILVLRLARHDPGARLLLAAALGLVPAATYALASGLAARNFAGLSVLSAIALGIAGAALVSAIRSRLAGPSGFDTAPSRAIAALVLGAMILVGVAGPVLGQRAVRPPPSDRLTNGLVAWVGANVANGGRVVMTFREREEVALRRFGQTEVDLLAVRRVDANVPPERFIWMGLRDRQLFGYPRDGWVATLTDPPAAFLLLVGPHPFTPTDLLGDHPDPAVAGLTRVATMEADDDRADIFRIDPNDVRDGTTALPLHLSAEAALAWLDLAAGPAAVDRLVAARPVITAGDVGALMTRLGDRACAQPGGLAGARIQPAGTCAGSAVLRGRTGPKDPPDHPTGL